MGCLPIQKQLADSFLPRTPCCLRSHRRSLRSMSPTPAAFYFLADDIVLGFLHPPGAGVDGAPLQNLYAFERVHLQPGEMKTVSLYPSLLDFTSVGHDGVRQALGGEYTFVFGVKRTQQQGMGYAEHWVPVKMDDSSTVVTH